MDVHGDSRVRKNKVSKESQLNEYYQRRCVNYERFLCDRTWECALCARQAGKVESVEGIPLPMANHLRRR